ncbi:hypothetical protein NM688_g366 [Phlebia brevispora]|uniref:Uncharacterized protein n=1 Tax=Phlebia brevispora TaxID=194682 RepID=A0ACC1TE70_9APHY|nr:hypothetical protein NM688_g366 [Phlebia brevispora]
MQMCHRQLRFNKSVDCGHVTLTSDTNIDCRDRHCYNSRAHPADCGANGKSPCVCRRYFTQPDRLYRDVRLLSADPARPTS